MSRLPKEDLLKKLSEKLGDDDDSLAILEDVADSMDPVDVKGYEDQIAALEKQVVETEETWRNKYKARFTEPAAVAKTDDPKVVDPADGQSEEEISIEDLAAQIKL